MVQNLQEVESMGTDKMDTKQEQRNKENEEIREMGSSPNCSSGKVNF